MSALTTRTGVAESPSIRGIRALIKKINGDYHGAN
jgi:hypothetical protein